MWRRPTGGRCSSACCATCWPTPCRGPTLFRLSLIGAKLASPLAPVAKSFGATRIAALLGLVPKRMPTPERFGQPGTYPATGDEEGPRGAADGLRAERARPRHQRRDHPAADAAGLRGRGLGRGGLLRLAHPPHGQGGRCAGPRPALGRPVDEGGCRCRDRHRLGLRHHHQGLWPHAAPRSGLCGEGRRPSAPRRRT